MPQQLLAVHGVPSALAASCTSTFTPVFCSSERQVAYVSGKSTPVSMVNTRASGVIWRSMWISTVSSFWKEQASASDGWCLATASSRTDFGGHQTAHSPSPRWTS